MALADAAFELQIKNSLFRELGGYKFVLLLNNSIVMAKV